MTRNAMKFVSESTRIERVIKSMESKYKNHFLYPLLRLFCSHLVIEAQHYASMEGDDKISGVQGHSWVHSELGQSQFWLPKILFRRSWTTHNKWMHEQIKAFYPEILKIYQNKIEKYPCQLISIKSYTKSIYISEVLSSHFHSCNT